MEARPLAISRLKRRRIVATERSSTLAISSWVHPIFASRSASLACSSVTF